MRFIQTFDLRFVTAACCALVLSHGVAALADPTVEVVQSVPIETNLTVPGIPQTQQVWLDIINGAQSTIDLEEFYVTSQAGQALEPVLNALEAAAARGVQVRLIVDLSFYKNYSNDPNTLAQIPGIQVKTIDFSSLDGIQHSKYFVVDGNQFYAGSANFDWLALTHIHEIGLHITDAALAQGLETIFQADWANANESRLISGATNSSVNPTADASNFFAYAFPAGFQLMASPPAQTPSGIADSLTQILAALNAAQSSIQIQVYEYDTKVFKSAERWHDLDNAIRAAAARGVKVQLAVDQTALKAGKADLEGLAQVSGIEVRVVTIPQWSGGAIPYARLVHSKYFITDNSLAWVGSENWDRNYFMGSRNVGIMLTDPTVVSNLGQVFNQVWNSGYTAAP